MKSKLFAVFFALPVTTGICGSLLRAFQLRYAYDPEIGVLKNAQPITYGLITVCIIAALMAMIAAFLLKSGVKIKSEKLPEISALCISVASVIILAHAAMVLFSLSEAFSATQLVLGLLSVYCSVSLFAMAKYRLSERNNTVYCIFSAVPVFWTCFLIILTFREKISDPVIANYVPMIFAYICILFFSYSICAHLLGKDKRHIAVISCFLGIFFILIEIFSPLFSGGIVIYDVTKIRELLPQIAFFILMPPVCAQIIKK